MIDRKTFSERMKLLRQQRKITMVDIANALEISKQSVHAWEQMKALPSADKLAELADYFDVSVDYLIGRSDDPPKL